MSQKGNLNVIEKKGINPVWFFPLAAVAIGLWLIYSNVMARGSYITINFKNADGITPNKTSVIYKGTVVGKVKDVYLNKSLSSVAVHVEMHSTMKKYLSKDTKFWLVSPKVNLSGISGLSTIISGKFINMFPAKGKRVKVFSAEESEPRTLRSDGTYLKLTTKKLDSISQGSPVYYNKVQVGEVKNYDLDAEHNQVEVTVFIKKKYSKLLKTTSRFYNVSGINVEGSLKTLSIQTESLTSIVKGGIAFVNYDTNKTAEITKNYQKKFPLFKSIADARPGRRIHITFPLGTSVTDEKTPIKYKNITIGQVTSVRIKPKREELIATANINPKYARLVSSGAKFWEAKPKLSLNGIESIDAILGSYINVDIDQDSYKKGKRKKRFVALEKSPLKSIQGEDGLHIKVYSKRRDSLARGQGVYYRGIKVGLITEVRLNSRAKNVISELFIKEPYHKLIKDETKFWNMSGIDLEVGFFSGAKINTQSLETLLSGGIEFATPNKFQKRKREIFKLNRKAELEWLEWKPVIKL